VRVRLPPKGAWTRRVCFAVRRAVTWPLRAGFELRTRRTARHARVVGLDVYIDADSKDPNDTQVVVDRLSAALELLNLIDPRRLARIRDEVPRVYIEPAASSRYFAASNAIGLALRLVQRHDAETIAATLVHEATHARIERRGIRAWPDLLSRIERRCVLEEIAFLEKVPGADDLIAHYRAQLDRPWWTPQRRFERMVRYFEEIGAPRWFLRAYQVLAKPRIASF
jgi:hypothetical protein